MTGYVLMNMQINLTVNPLQTLYLFPKQKTVIKRLLLLTRFSSAMLRITILLAAMHVVFFAQAQLCNGSLGDPVVNIDFGSEGGANPGYTPNNAYTYTSSSCPDDGFYTITKSTFACFGNSWHTVTSDHTGNGAFMLVNASFEPGDFLVATVTDLCPNTNYQFAAWIMNVLLRFGIRPNLTFKIETENGTVLSEYSTGDIPETAQPSWKQYGFFFTTPADNTVITLRITNNAPGGIGNDIALDDITFRPCGPGITADIEGAADTVNVCKGDTASYLFTAAVSNGFNDPVYQWQVSNDLGKTWLDIAGANTLTYLRKPSTQGFYWYRMAIAELSSVSILSCRVASNAVVINVHDAPATSAGPDRISIGGTPVILQGSITGESPSYFWSPPTYLNSDTVLTPETSTPADINYTLIATSAFGCQSSDMVQVKAVAGIFVPNAFTPNHDGKNDYWHIPYLDPLLEASVNVYNRYGQVIYHTEAETVNWDGTVNGIPQAAGTYIYYIHFKSAYPDIKGTLTLLR